MKRWMPVAAAVVVGLIVALLALVRPAPPVTPAPPVRVPASVAPASQPLSTSTPVPVQPSSGTTSTTAQPSLPPGVTNEAGEEVGDPAQAPVISPSDLADATTAARSFWMAFTSYGYGDANPYDHIVKAQPYMSTSARAHWNRVMSAPVASSDLNAWKALVAQGQRNQAFIVDIYGVDTDATGVNLAVVYRTGTTSFNNAQVDARNPVSTQPLHLTRRNGSWGVDYVG